ncbi:MAG: hypothetical protein ACERKN_00370 [Velocimicrobium sp.]
MKNYEKPMVLTNEEMSEGIYAASGDTTPTDTGYKCKSIYMNGVYLLGTYSPITDGYKIGRGCEGCPANWGKCAISEVNYDNDFRPTWEISGHLPDELGY